MTFNPLPSLQRSTIAKSCLNEGKPEPGLGHALDLRPQTFNGYGNIPESSRENEGADCGAHAEDQSDVGENEEIG
jgi:hypothetical protein